MNKVQRRPWGTYESVAQDATYQVKRIIVEPQQRLSLQKHFHRSEHWVVVAGEAIVNKDQEVISLRTNEGVYLPKECVHRLSNPSKENPLILIEVQSGSYLGEDDIVRLDDDYKRG